MSTLDWFILGILTSIIIMAATSSDAETTVWHWTAEETLAYTDDEKRIPLKYREDAVSFVVDGLDSYEKYTPVKGSDVDRKD